MLRTDGRDIRHDFNSSAHQREAQHRFELSSNAAGPASWFDIWIQETKLAQRPVDVIVGARLAALRMARGVSQDALGSVLGITGTEIANYESRAVRIPAAHLVEISRFFQVRLQDLFPSRDPDHDPGLH
jgi:hypothetical protein